MLFITPLPAAPALAQQGSESSRIEYLIESVAALHGAVFVRNGSEYDAHQAADHLRAKLRSAGTRVKTADDFIVYCATGSSLTGEKYTIRFADGHLVDTAEFLRAQLAGYAPTQPHSN